MTYVYYIEQLSNASEHANQLACTEHSGLNSEANIEVPSFEPQWLQK